MDKELIKEILNKYDKLIDVTEKTLIDVKIKNTDKAICSIFPNDRYIQFHDEFTQIGSMLEFVRELMDEMNLDDINKWSYNLD